MLSDGEFRRLLDHLDRPWAGFRKVRKGVKKRVRRHMETLGCASIDAYLTRIDSDPLARNTCETCLIVTISRFFRDRRLWDYLRSRGLPDLMGRSPDQLAVWSAGCANGEEPYSLAMIGEDLSASGATAALLQIHATDANPASLERARVGFYPASSLKEVPEAFKNRWFEKTRGGRQWRINPRLQQRITWQAHQLFDKPPSETFQVVMLRNNLLTYYRGAAMLAAFKRIAATVPQGGLLILGSHERLPTSDLPLVRNEDCPWIYHKSG